MSKVEGPTSTKRSFKYTHLPISKCALAGEGGGLYCTALFSPHNNFFKEEIITYTKEAELKDFFSHADRSVVCFCIIFVLVFPAVLLS